MANTKAEDRVSTVDSIVHITFIRITTRFIRIVVGMELDTMPCPFTGYAPDAQLNLNDLKTKIITQRAMVVCVGVRSTLLIS